MKRSLAASPSSPAPKKAKLSMEDNQESLHQQNSDGTDEWTKVEKRKAKKINKQEARLDANPPQFKYSQKGINKKDHGVTIENVRDLILHLSANAPSPDWVKVENAGSVKKVVALLIPGLTSEMLNLPPYPTSATINPYLPIPVPAPNEESSAPYIAKTFSHACPTNAPGDNMRMHSVLSAFFQTPVSGTEKKKRLDERLKSERAMPKDPTRFTLTLEQMIENDYPIPSYLADVFEKPTGWVETPQQPSQPLTEPVLMRSRAKIYAIDCEMCMTEDGKELARVSVIDFDSGAVIYDELVRPSKPITDYLTRWSGITETALDNVTTRLSDVQQHLLTLLTPPGSEETPILLGHSLESDLNALKLCHPRCIDTAVIFHHPRGRPLKPGLAWLTKKWVGREIQNRGEGGHDPEEDARACIDLLKKKVENGSGFGEFRTDYESIFERMSRGSVPSGPGSLRSAVVDYGNPAVMHGSKATTNVACKNDADILEGLLQTIPSHDFVFGRLTSLAEAMGWIRPKAQDPAPGSGPFAPLPSSDAPPSEIPLSELKTLLIELDKRLTKIHDALPSRTALIIFTGHSDPRRMVQLNARKMAFETALKSGKMPENIFPEIRWTTEDAREMEGAVTRAKRGLLFLGVK